MLDIAAQKLETTATSWLLAGKALTRPWACKRPSGTARPGCTQLETATTSPLLAGTALTRPWACRRTAGTASRSARGRCHSGRGGGTVPGTRR